MEDAAPVLDAFAPPRTEEGTSGAGAPGGADPHLTVARAALAFGAFQGLAVSLLMPPATLLGVLDEPSLATLPGAIWVGLSVGVFTSGVVAVSAMLCGLAVYGTRRADETGFALAVLGAIVLSLGCMPLGIHALFAVLRPEGRRHFGLS